MIHEVAREICDHKENAACRRCYAIARRVIRIIETYEVKESTG